MAFDVNLIKNELNSHNLAQIGTANLILDIRYNSFRNRLLNYPKLSPRQELVFLNRTMSLLLILLRSF